MGDSNQNNKKKNHTKSGLKKLGMAALTIVEIVIGSKK